VFSPTVAYFLISKSKTKIGRLTPTQPFAEGFSPTIAYLLISKSKTKIGRLTPTQPLRRGVFTQRLPTL
jgi:hypothetical protein